MLRAGWNYQNTLWCDDCMNTKASKEAVAVGVAYCHTSDSDPADIIHDWGMNIGVFSDENTDPTVLPIPIPEADAEGKHCHQCDRSFVVSF